jgi:hypothetical protein
MLRFVLLYAAFVVGLTIIHLLQPVEVTQAKVADSYHEPDSIAYPILVEGSPATTAVVVGYEIWPELQSL